MLLNTDISQMDQQKGLIIRLKYLKEYLMAYETLNTLRTEF